MTTPDASALAELERGTAEAEAMLRKHMAMYDWSPKETAAINDFILTIREGIAEDLAAMASSGAADGDDARIRKFAGYVALQYDAVSREEMDHLADLFLRRSLPPSAPSDDTPARRGRLSEHPCDRCKQHEVYVSQDSNDDADYTIHCYGCGHHYRVDGPDA